MRHRGLPSARGCALLPILCVVVLALGCADPMPNEARLLLDRMDRLDPDDVESRRALVAALRAMPLRSEDVVAARDACVAMHETLLRAEDLSAEARAALTAAEAAGGTLDPASQRRIESLLAESQASIDRVRGLEAPCQGRIEELRSRFGGH